MKKCPFCAEDIQDLAIVCKHCGRDLPGAVPLAAQPPAAAKEHKKPQRAWLWFAGLGALVLWMVYAWGNTAYSVDLPAAQKAVHMMESEGGIKDRSCSPNRAVMPRSYWNSIPNESTKEHVMNALARLCIAEGGKTDMMLVDERGAVIAQFDGTSIVR